MNRTRRQGLLQRLADHHFPPVPCPECTNPGSPAYLYPVMERYGLACAGFCPDEIRAELTGSEQPESGER